MKKSKFNQKGNKISRRDFLSKTSKAAVGLGIAGALGTVMSPKRAWADKKPVRYWSWLDPKDPGPRSAVQTEIIKEFEEKTGIQVEVELVDWKTIPQQLMRAVAADEGPDVVRLYNPWLAEQTAAENIVPLDQYITKEDLEDIGSPPLKFGGNTMAVYIENRYYGVIYRADLVKQAGFETPKTFDEVGRCAGKIRKMSDGKVTGIVWEANRSAPAIPIQLLPAMIWSFGGTGLIDENQKAAFNSEAGIKVFQWIYDLVYKYEAFPATYVNWQHNEVQQALNAGTLAMFMDGTNRVVHSRGFHDDPTKIQFTHFPSPEGTPPPVPVYGWTLGMSRSSKNRDEAWALIDALTNTHAQVLNAQKAGETPTRKSALQDPWFGTDEAAEMRTWVEYISKNSRPDPTQQVVQVNQLGDLLNIAIQEIILKKRPIKEALDEAAANWNKLV